MSDTIEANISATDPDNGAGGVVSFSLKVHRIHCKLFGDCCDFRLLEPFWWFIAMGWYPSSSIVRIRLGSSQQLLSQSLAILDVAPVRQEDQDQWEWGLKCYSMKIYQKKDVLKFWVSCLSCFDYVFIIVFVYCHNRW